jgi:hypothetical protein
MFGRLTFAIAVLIAAGPLGAGTFKFPAGASSYIVDGEPGRSAWREETLRAEGRRTTTYLRFYVGWVQGERITSARLRLATSHWHEAPIPATFDLLGLPDGAPGDGAEDWREYDLTSANAPAYEPGKGLDASKCRQLAVATVAPHIPDMSKTPVGFDSPELKAFLEADRNGWVTLIVRWAGGGDGNCCFHSTRSLPDPEAQPTLVLQTDGPHGADLSRETIILRAGPRQTLSGYGCGSGWDHGPNQNFGKPDEARQAHLAKATFTDTHMNTFRVWAILDKISSRPGEFNFEPFRKGYVDSGLVRHAKTAGVQRFLLSPAGVPLHMLTAEGSPAAAGQKALRDDAVPAYAELVAEVVRAAKAEAGWDLYATTIANECVNITIPQWPRVVRELRQALNARGLTGVKIGAVDWPNNDNWAVDRLDAIRKDPEAWKALDIVTTHSYSMPMTEEIFQELVWPARKELWITESACSGPTRAAAAKDLAGHMLNDLGKGATCWIYHESLLNTTPDNPATIIGFDTEAPDDQWLLLWPKYHVYRQLSETFARGAVMRQAWSNRQGTLQYPMSYTPYTAAGGRNADGSWALGLVNLTDPGPQAKAITLQVALEEAAGIAEMRMKAVRSGPSQQLVSEADVIVRHGLATVTLGPGELLTLRAK